MGFIKRRKVAAVFECPVCFGTMLEIAAYRSTQHDRRASRTHGTKAYTATEYLGGLGRYDRQNTAAVSSLEARSLITALQRQRFVASDEQLSCVITGTIPYRMVI